MKKNITRKCPKCSIIKDISDFTKYGKYCKPCVKEYSKQYYLKNKEKNKEKNNERRRQYYLDNKDKVKEKKRQYYLDNKEKIKLYHKKYQEDNKEKIKIYKKIYSKKNSEKAKQRVYKWRLEKYGDKQAEIKERKEKRERAAMIRRCEREYNRRYLHPIKVKLRIRLITALKQNTLSKKSSAIKMLGCSVHELKEHLEKQFVKGMTWENNNSKGWHIDHIIPLASANTEEEMELLCHYSNLQPLWAADNHKKRDKVPILTNLHFINHSL